MRKFIVIDTETAPRVRHSDNQPHPEDSLVYDIGWVVTDIDGFIYEEHSIMLTDTFDNREYMDSAYYADKRPKYEDGLRAGEWEHMHFLEAWKLFCDNCKTYKVKTVWAYNALFDIKALNATIRYWSNGYRSYFLPYQCEWKDIWAYAGSTICATKKYVQWCRDNDYLTANKNPQTSAEKVYRYVTDREDFIEDHTALSDAKIEMFILCKAKKRKQKARHKMGCGDLAARKINKEME